MPNGPTLTRETDWPQTRRSTTSTPSFPTTRPTWPPAMTPSHRSWPSYWSIASRHPWTSRSRPTSYFSRAAAHRRFRLRRLRWTRRIVALAALFFLSGPGDSWGPDSGISFRVTRATEPLGGLLPWSGHPRADAATTIGAVGVAVVAAMLYWVAFLIWRVWDREAFRRMIYREPKVESMLHQRLLVAWWGLVIFLALVGDCLVLDLTRPRNLRRPLCDDFLAAGFHVPRCRDLNAIFWLFGGEESAQRTTFPRTPHLLL